MGLKYPYYLLMICSMLSQSLWAQESLPIWNFTHIDYQAQQQNWSIGQSPEGFIYVGNSDGLLEYDGANWKLYPLPNGQPVRSVFCEGNRVYVGGYGEFGYWEKTDALLHYHSLRAQCDIPSAETEEIWHILKTSDAIYFQSFSSIYQVTWSIEGNPEIIEIKAPENFMFLYEVNGRLLLQFINREIYEMKEGDFHLLPGTEALTGTSVSALLPYGNDELMIVTQKDGVFLWNSGKIRNWSPNNAATFRNDLINKALLLNDGNYAIGTQLSGVYVLSPEGEIHQHFHKPNGLQNNSVLGFHQDKQQNLWVALDKGIDLIPLSSPVSQYKSDEFPLESTYSVALWRDKLYAGTNRGVFWKPWPSDEAFKPISGLEGHVWELKVYQDQLLCGHSEGTYRITDNGFEKLSNIHGGWITQLLETGNDTILLQGTYTGLSVYRRTKSGKWYFSHSVDGVPPVPIKFIARAENGTLWLAHAYKGLYKATLSDDASRALIWEKIKNPSELGEAYNIEVINWNGSILIQSENRFYTPDREDRLELTKGFNSISELKSKIRPGMNGDFFRIFPDHVILRTASGSQITIPVVLIRNHEAVIPIGDRYYFFCTHNGYFVYDRERPTHPNESIRPVLRNVSDLYDPSRLFSTKNSVTIPAESRSLQLDFVMPVFGESIQFSYRLIGATEEWSDWSARRSAIFTNLPPGTYHFELRNSYNSQVLHYKFKILPFWHESNWARITILLIGGLILLSLYYWQENRLISQREQLIREHEKELKQRELENQKRIIELQNEKLASEINLKSQQLSNIAINVIRKNEILESIKNELVQVKNDLGQQLPNVHYQKLLDSINRNLSGKEDWTLFEDNFDDVHEEFFKRLKLRHPDITPSELRLAAALRMNLSSKEIAPVLGISVRGVEIKRYRLRKKLGLDESVNLNSYMMEV